MGKAPLDMLVLLLTASCCWARWPEIGLSNTPYSRLNYDAFRGPGGEAATPEDLAWLGQTVGRIPLVYVVLFPGRRVALGTEFTHIDEYTGKFNKSIGAFFVGGRCAFFPMDPGAYKGIYLLGHLGVLGTSWYFNHDYGFAVGPGIGYSWRIREIVAVALEGRYARWIQRGIHDPSLLIRIGFSP